MLMNCRKRLRDDCDSKSGKTNASLDVFVIHAARALASGTVNAQELCRFGQFSKENLWQLYLHLQIEVPHRGGNEEARVQHYEQTCAPDPVEPF